jgi:similar to spore coat protein
VRNHLGQHESLELHELVVFKSLCTTKSATMSKLAQDPELKTLLEADAQAGQQHLQQLKQLLPGGGVTQ